jgi:Family of unknown function (DUF5994)
VRFELASELRDRSLHGAWWPHSRDAGDELSALVPALPASLGTISRMALSTTSWTNRTRRTASQRGRAVRIGWFSVVDPNVLTLVRPDEPRLRLLIVPPEASEESASNALDAAAAQGPTEGPADLLVTAGVQDVQRARPGDLGMYRGTNQ